MFFQTLPQKTKERLMIRPASISVLLAAVVCLSISFPGVSRAASEKNEHLIINSGDMLDIRFPSAPQMSRQYPVGQNGAIYFPVLEDVNLGGFYVAGPDKQCSCTVEELTQILEKKLGEFYQPDRTMVEIDLVSMNLRVEQTVYLMGEVMAPGAIRHFDGMKMIDVLVRGARINEKADTKIVRINRGGVNLPAMDITGMVDGTDFSQNVAVFPGDIIIVPPKSITELKVIALGSIAGVGSFTMPVGSRALDLFAKVGGGNGRAGVGRAYIIRMVDNKATAITLDFKALINRLDLSQNIELQHEDIFFVPESKGVDLAKVLSSLTMMNFVKTIFDNKN